ncbi:MAG: PQQ-binding-like beta-propeller repeat protein [Pseudomonadota bacterium]
MIPTLNRAGRMGLLSLGLALSGCGLFDDEVILEGEREPVRVEAAFDTGALAPPPLLLTPASTNTAWTHKNGSAAHSISHPALAAAPSRIWSVGVGQGSGRDSRLTATPVVADGRIYTLDAASRVTAVDSGGGTVWRVSLAPPREAGDQGFGGGVVLGGGRLFATTGFADVIALDPATGEELWRRRVDAPFRAAPVYDAGILVAVSRDDIVYGLDPADGRVLWRRQGARGSAGLIGGAAPAAAAGIAVVPFSSGEVSGIVTRTGRRIWAVALSGGRRGLTRADIPDITGDPVIAGDAVYVANQSGALSAIDRRSGARLWTRGDGAFGPVWPEGGSIFFVSDEAVLIRADASTGETIWRQELRQYRDPDDRDDVILYHGPILAGGRLLLASSRGDLFAFDPDTGAELGEPLNVPGGAGVQPAVADGTLYILSRGATLHAYR